MTEYVAGRMRGIIEAHLRIDSLPLDLGDGMTLSPGELRCLRAVERCAGGNVKAVGDLLGVSKSAASQMIRRLAERGFAAKHAATGNDKEVLVLITRRGKSALDTHQDRQARHLAVLERRLDGFTLDQMLTVARFMDIAEDVMRQRMDAASAARADSPGSAHAAPGTSNATGAPDAQPHHPTTGTPTAAGQAPASPSPTPAAPPSPLPARPATRPHGGQSYTRVNADQVFAALGLAPGQTFLDLGCGPGGYSLHAARLLGPRGAVLAMDIAPQRIADLAAKATEAGLTTVRPQVQDITAPLPLPDASVDVCLVATVLHILRTAERRRPVLDEIRRVLRPGGTLAVLELKKRPMPFGPPLEQRIAEDDLLDLARQCGFRPAPVVNLGDFYLAPLHSP